MNPFSLHRSLEIISRIMDAHDCPEDILREIPEQHEVLARLCRQLYTLRQALDGLLEGNRSVKVEGDGHVSSSFRALVDRLNTIEQKVKKWTEQTEAPRSSACCLLSQHVDRLDTVLQRKQEFINRYIEQSLTDALTGLLNRRGFAAAAEVIVARACRKGRTVSLCMADIDHFKHINDTYGHVAGDVILHTVARRLRGCLRAEDVCCRYGGEEFLILLYDTELEHAVHVAERMRKSIEEDVFPVDGHSLRVTISLGVSEVPLEGVSRPECRHETVLRGIQRADAFLYTAKGMGRNRVASELTEPCSVQEEIP